MNIAAFNLGNAIGAWLGAVVIESALGLGAVSWVAALVTLSGLAIAVYSVRLDRVETGVRAPACRAAV